MSEIFVKNISSNADALSLMAVGILKEKIADWQKNNNFSAGILVQDKKEDQNKFCFITEKNAADLLNKDVQLNLLSAKIDRVLRNSGNSETENLNFVFYIGFTSAQFEKLIEKSTGSEKKQKSRIAVSPVEPKFSFDQVILPKETKNQIDEVISLLKNMQKIYYAWGFIEIDPVPRSVVNFFGPPGTGKTMTVHAIAKELEKKVLILNYADIESKYVGEAPKNLIAAFDIAEKEDAVIFFDEADSFLGKRITNVDSGSEQAINSLRSQMLMKLEEFNGIVFFATNLHENYDRAFESRILRHIEFKLPDLETRKQIIKSKLPKKAPYAENIFAEDSMIFDKLAEISDGFSGREIKNCVLQALVLAAKSSSKIDEKILTKAFNSKKEEKDALKRKEQERKEKLSKNIKTNLDTNNFNIKKTDENQQEGDKNDK